jgi:hypothetical protein
MGNYEKVLVVNATNCNISGTVTYRSAFCKDDNYQANAKANWRASSRGGCLVTEVTATVTTPSGIVQAAPYQSIGTAYSQFAVIPIGGNAFEVIRIDR